MSSSHRRTLGVLLSFASVAIAAAQLPDLVNRAEVSAAMAATKSTARDPQAQAAADLAIRQFAAYLAANPAAPLAPDATAALADIAASIREQCRPAPAPMLAAASKLPALPTPVENAWTPGSFNKMNWGREAYHALAWRPGNVTTDASGAIRLTSDASGEAGLISGSRWTGGVIEYDVTFPAVIPSGVDVAAGFLYGGGDEIDFPEVLQDGRPRFAIHADGKQVAKIIDADVRGSRHTFGVTWKPGDFVTFTMDGKDVWTVKADALPPEIGRLPKNPMAFVSAVSLVPGLAAWAGPFTMSTTGVTATIHGWHYVQF